MSNKIEIHNLSSKEWLLSVPSMQTATLQFECIIDEQQGYLYGIGGESNATPSVPSIEGILINDIGTEYAQ